MPARPKPRVLIIDNDPRVGEDYLDLLAPREYEVQVAQGSGPSLLDQASAQARKFRPHVSVVDLRLLYESNDADRSGFKLLEKLGSGRRILHSAYLTDEITSVAARRYGAFDWVSKTEPRRLIQSIERACQEVCASCRNVKIDLPETWSPERVVRTLFGRNTDIPPALVNDLLLQLSLASKEIRLEAMPGTPVAPVSSGRSRSVVFKAWYDDRHEPLVVKLVPAGKANQEGKNYQKYIEDNLGGRFHAALKRPPVIFWDVGAVLYTFVGAPRRALESFEAFYRRQTNPKLILQPLEHFFAEVWGNFYQNSREAIKKSLYSAYDEALSIDRHVKKLSRQEAKISFPGITVPLRKPASWVLQNSDNSLIPGASQAKMHGDLHGNNLFVDEEHAWAIDFERSGPGPILRDFAELEVNIATRLFPCGEADDLSRLFRLAVLSASLEKADVSRLPMTASFNSAQDASRITKEEAEFLRGDEEAQKALGVIRGLHWLADKLINSPDKREYLWALLCDSLYSAAHAAQGSSRRERTLLYGAVICERLEHWGEEWPPKGWLLNLHADRLNQAYDR